MRPNHLRLRGLCAALLALPLALGCRGAPRAAEGATVASTVAVPAWPTAPAAVPLLAPAEVGEPETERAASALLAAPPSPPARDVRMPTDWHADYAWSGAERLAHAKRSKGREVEALFDDAGVTFPPHDVLFRIFKKERELEVWAGDEDQPMKLIATYGICAASGILGPKRREGDLQVPEGYYKVGYYHPTSAYYLSAQIDYPNLSDKIRGGPAPGGDILIHGSCASIGCVSMTDERIEEIYLVGWSAFMQGRPTNIHLFPSRDIDALLRDPSLSANHAFWREIEPGLVAFDRTHRVPSVRIDERGRYVITPAT